MLRPLNACLPLAYPQFAECLHAGSVSLADAANVPRGRPPLHRRRVDFYTKSRAFDISRARSELGYAPSVGLDEGIRRTLDWYRANGWI